MDLSLKTRAVAYNMISKARNVYFDAMQQTDKNYILGYTDRKHKSAAAKLSRKDIKRLDKDTGATDVKNNAIYSNDTLQVSIVVDGKRETVHHQVFERNGAFGVDLSREQGERVNVLLLAEFLRKYPEAVVSGVLAWDKEVAHA